MNSNTTEELVKQKIESLTTLQAGIVFGHEDAWDKLQARLDAKPVRKPFPIFRLAAAAAIVLAIITVAMIYLQPKSNNTSNNDVIAINPTPSNPLPAHDNIPPADSFKTTVNIPATNNSAPVKPHHIKPSAPHPISPGPQPIVQVPQPTTDLVPPPAPTPRPVMKVVHINELGKEPAPVYEFAGKDIPHPHVMFKMKVVHINNLLKPINQDDYLREIQNNTAVHFPLFRRPSDRQPNDQPRTFFKINLSN